MSCTERMARGSSGSSVGLVAARYKMESTSVHPSTSVAPSARSSWWTHCSTRSCVSMCAHRRCNSSSGPSRWRSHAPPQLPSSPQPPAAPTARSRRAPATVATAPFVARKAGGVPPSRPYSTAARTTRASASMPNTRMRVILWLATGSKNWVTSGHNVGARCKFAIVVSMKRVRAKRRGGMAASEPGAASFSLEVASKASDAKH
mmetsp:Transcript_29900/g.91773  ORF Transcript_29900/g.91773 Transcript_29900/m.91773 type:complete len:204 (+) Transcript_29900:350-961(+)|eukprot:scaffold186388_cov29-Tisochrysis_lutea.AAC.4